MAVQAKRRADYQPPAFSIATVDLHITLHPTNTRVLSQLHIERQGLHNEPLVLDGDNLPVVSLRINGQEVTDNQSASEYYELSDSTLSIYTNRSDFQLEVETQISPEQNKALEGLYLSGGAYCTQCEAEGFRRITFFLDRPDVLSVYTVTVVADKSVPMLLANGNPIDKGELDNNQHFVKWHDPHPKPCYLFALVAGDFDLLTDHYTTKSGKDVALELYVDKGKKNQGQFALDSLKRAMKWDEDVFGLEYDLDIYMIVAVDFFNMGAMENKGLNVFNSKFVLANTESATDDDYFNIESVIGHEYFHNWTGNRVTCRDWFQLSLKEGLTVFRDQLFSETFHSALSTRIKQVNVIREHQFAEDAGPMSHPIRPDEVIEMNNFYTVTAYDKGAEVIRMLWTLLGQQGFKNGLALYFERHDGQAVTCDDFVDAMQVANDIDLSVFKRWYSQSGTPQVSYAVEGNCLTVHQQTPVTADQKTKQPLFIPLAIQLIDKNNIDQKPIERLLHLTDQSTTIEFEQDLTHYGVVINSGFSAPVKVITTQTIEDYNAILNGGTNDFDRWEASQQLYLMAIEAAQQNQLDVVESIAICMKRFIQSNSHNLELISEAIVVPSLESIIANAEHIDLDDLVASRKRVITALSAQLESVLLELLDALLPRQSYLYDAKSITERRFINSAMKLLSASEKVDDAINALFEQADNMTDALTALQAAQLKQGDLFENLMSSFEQRWKDDPLVLDKWFSLHATSERPDILSRITLLMDHDQFTVKNPNRIRALLGSFAFYNTVGLHQVNGEGYRFFVDQLMTIDEVNPQVAARIVTPLLSWKKFDRQRQEYIQFHLTRLLDRPNVSPDLFEKISKSLSK